MINRLPVGKITPRWKVAGTYHQGPVPCIFNAMTAAHTAIKTTKTIKSRFIVLLLRVFTLPLSLPVPGETSGKLPILITEIQSARVKNQSELALRRTKLVF